MNTYAHSKVAGERIILKARESGLISNICRFSNVYGAADDHVDRAVNAFAKAAAFGGTIRLEGPALGSSGRKVISRCQV
ncbi:NAD-dependent epimerase/dehydratase family protein [Sinorhizobium meliloti]|nr:NAD-dependent epimerase/dehydratase family protein [Sinorhizobium meliloti]RVM20824.1 NAD-dependent epimerase/dehydratase family protein [Sinorhizobium meliloti]RVN99554.1 NAD-dependent epimerase/dehydratase family protein [Sinorhizobium meliloti]WQP20083.1 SDR family oxidoreductase [Sinorhizobium meliloti]